MQAILAIFLISAFCTVDFISARSSGGGRGHSSSRSSSGHSSGSHSSGFHGGFTPTHSGSTYHSDGTTYVFISHNHYYSSGSSTGSHSSSSNSHSPTSHVLVNETDYSNETISYHNCVNGTGEAEGYMVCEVDSPPIPLQVAVICSIFFVASIVVFAVFFVFECKKENRKLYLWSRCFVFQLAAILMCGSKAISLLILGSTIGVTYAAYRFFKICLSKAPDCETEAESWEREFSLRLYAMAAMSACATFVLGVSMLFLPDDWHY